MFDYFNTINNIKKTINNNILPQLDFLESQYLISESYGLKLLSDVASNISENNSNTQCYARTSKSTRCTNNIAKSGDNQLEITNMYCNHHCMCYERTTRNKPKKGLIYGDIRLIGQNCISKSINNDKFIKHMTNDNLLSDKLRISSNYGNNNKELFNKLCSICVI